MNFVVFLLGFSVGFSFFLWQHAKRNSQLRQLLGLLPASMAEISALPLISAIRSGIARTNQRYQTLERELQIWRQLLNIAPLGYLQVDGENQLSWCNHKAKQLLILDRWQPGTNRLLLELVRSYELDQLIETTRQTQQSQTQEWVFYRTNSPGSEKSTPNSQSNPSRTSIALKGYGFPLSQGQVGIFLKNQQPLQTLIQSRDRALSDLSHELRTPLTSIGLVSEVLQERLSTPEREWVAKMHKEINRLINLVANYLDISQLERNPYENLNFQTVELKPIILSAWETLEGLGQQKTLTLSYTGEPSLSLQADQSRLTQVFLNLFDNSIKHSPVQGEIQVQIISDPQGMIEINIIDSGKGFVESDLPYVFERLYRGDRSRTRESADQDLIGQGSGLGLSIVQEIIQGHHGSIIAQNHPDTHGAWLQIKLPENLSLQPPLLKG